MGDWALDEVNAAEMSEVKRVCCADGSWKEESLRVTQKVSGESGGGESTATTWKSKCQCSGDCEGGISLG